MSKLKKNILIVAAHPDDEVLGCGGTIRRLSDEGSNVYIAILGEGITSRYSKREHVKKEKIDLLKAATNKVASKLGVKDVFMFDFPDNRFDTVALLDIVKKVEDIIEKIKPSIVFTHHGSDLNIDHQVTHRAVLTSTRPMSKNVVKEIYMFEIPSSTEWAFGQFNPVFCPDVFYDISGTLEIKIRAMQIYESEIRQFPHPRSPEALTAVASRWGTVAGIQSAEAFKLLRLIR
jgi:LmbE family N-acetylglucosaminyl deacetylase